MATIGTTPLLLFVLAQAAPVAVQAPAAQEALRSPAEVRAAFFKQLDRPRVPLDVKVEPPVPGEVRPDAFPEERLSFVSQNKGSKLPGGEVDVKGIPERVPVLIVKPRGSAADGRRRPAVIVLHGTGGTKERMRDWLEDLAKRGILGVAIDARYHGARVGVDQGSAAYVDAITRSWRATPGATAENPFYYDTVWDLWRTVDYLQTRPDVDPNRIGMLGTSMGGIQTWLAAAADERIAVAVPAIAVQSFRWSLENNAWQGRAKTIQAAHEAAAQDLKEPQVNAKVCIALWSKVIPGILGDFDCPSMLRLFAGRPLLILNGELDPNCPIGGAKVAFASAEAAFKAANASDRLKIDVAKGVAHQVTPAQRAMTLDWFERWLKP